MPQVDPRSVVHPRAVLHQGVKVGPYAIVEEDTKIGPNTVVGAHAVIKRWTTIGSDCTICEHALLGGAPQDIHYTGFPSYLKIGSGNVIREFVSIHRASRENESTVVGDGNFIMAYAHIGHDCIIGDNTIITNYAGLSGFVHVEDKAIISGHVGIHQFVRIGSLAIVSGCSGVSQDVPPFAIAAGRPAEVAGVNVIGLRRAGFSPAERKAIQKAYKLLFFSGMNLSHAIEEIEKEETNQHIERLISFIREAKRGVCRPKDLRKGMAE
jgi:UDP-N-acetylglucosamine acyltransferase